MDERRGPTVRLVVRRMLPLGLTFLALFVIWSGYLLAIAEWSLRSAFSSIIALPSLLLVTWIGWKAHRDPRFS
ncbi:MAG: hypothetical protein M3N29_03675 [Chloroflexota bacterium]|nr:hypothetical protein [Chloroflexota bacterium]